MTDTPGREIVGSYSTLDRHSFPYVGNHTYWDMELLTPDPVVTKYTFVCTVCGEKYRMFSDRASPNTTTCIKDRP